MAATEAVAGDGDATAADHKMEGKRRWEAQGQNGEECSKKR